MQENKGSLAKRLKGRKKIRKVPLIGTHNQKLHHRRTRERKDHLPKQSKRTKATPRKETAMTIKPKKSVKTNQNKRKGERKRTRVISLLRRNPIMTS